MEESRTFKAPSSFPDNDNLPFISFPYSIVILL
jgi:hypothetical protein